MYILHSHTFTSQYETLLTSIIDSQHFNIYFTFKNMKKALHRLFKLGSANSNQFYALIKHQIQAVVTSGNISFSLAPRSNKALTKHPNISPFMFIICELYIVYLLNCIIPI